MTEPTAWIADCHLQDREASEAGVVQDYACQVAVWAGSYESFRERLTAYLEKTPYKLLWVEECLEALEYIRRHGQQKKIGGLARAVHPGHLVELGPLSAEVAEPEALSFKEALLALDYKNAPVFAVLDGAQFDNLPKALFDGDFISRPLYLDRGENDPEQIITAPHMVTLDERSEKPKGRSYEDTLDALLTLIDNKPAAVFWQCPEGGDALYKHLRGINMVLYPKAALGDWEEPEPEETEDGLPPKEPDTHTMVLFRHADANVLAKILPCLGSNESHRFMGVASSVIYRPRGADEESNGPDWFTFEVVPKKKYQNIGPLTLSIDTLNRMNEHNERAVIQEIRDFVEESIPEIRSHISDRKINQLVIDSLESGKLIGFKEDFSFACWAYLVVLSSGAVSQDKAIHGALAQPGKTPDERLELLLEELQRTKTLEKILET